MQRKNKPQTTVKEWLGELWQDAKDVQKAATVGRRYQPQRNLWNSMEQGRAELANALGTVWNDQIATGIESTAPKIEAEELEKEPKPEAPKKTHNDLYISP